MAGRQEAQKLLAEQQKRLGEVEGLSGVKLDIDFDHFVNHSTFKESTRQDDLLRNLVSEVVEKGLWASDDGLVAWLNKSERAKRLFVEGTQRCVVRLAPDSQVDAGVGSSYYMIRIESATKTMVVTARMDCLSYTDGWGPKVDEQLGLHVLDEVYMAEATEMLKRSEERLRSDLSSGGATGADIALEIDWASFVNSREFLERGDSSRRSVIHSTVEDVLGKGLWDSSEGLLAWLAKSPRVRAIVLSRIAQVVVALSPDSNIESRKGNSYYQLRVDGATLTVTARLDCVSYTDGWGPKLDDELGLHVLDEEYMKEATQMVSQQETRLQSDLGGVGMLLEVDWASFISSREFLERGDSSRRSVIHSISESVIDKGLWDSSQGLVSAWINGSRRVRRLVLEQVNKIVIKLQPDGSLSNTGTGSSYYQVEHDARDGQQTLVVTARLDCVTYTDGWGPKVDERLGLHYLDETYLRKATEELAVKAATLQSDLGGKPLLHVDWDSFVRSREFLERGDSSRSSVIENVIDSVIQKGLWDSEGLVAFAREQSGLLAQLAAVVVKLAPDSQINSETGNSYYGLSVSAGPTITVTARLDCVSYTDGWKEKLKHHLNDLKNAAKAPVELDQVHEYLREQPEPSLPGPAIPCDIHPYMLAPGQIATPQLSDEAKQAREQALVAAKAKKEAEEAKKREAEEAQRLRLEEQRRKREEAQAALRARQAERKSASPAAGRPLPTPSKASSPAPKVGAPDESISGVKDLLKDLKSYGSQFNAAVGGGCAVEFDVDWSFLTDRAFTQLSEDERRTCITYHLHSNCVSSLVSQLNYVVRDPTAKEEIQSALFVRVVVGFDMTNSIASRVVDSDYSRFYEVALRDGDLHMRVNFNKRESGLGSLDDKLACALNLQVAQSKAGARKELDELEKRIVAQMNTSIALDVDWSFTESDAFLGAALTQEVVPLDDLRRYGTIIQNLHYQYVQGVVSNSESLLYLCRDDEIYKAAVIERISSIVFTYDPTNSVNSSVGNDYGRHWEMKLDAPAKKLHVIINLSAHDKSASNAKEKWDELMQLRTAQGIRNVDKELAAMVAKERARFGKSIEAQVVWDSFVNHSAYTSLSLDAKSTLLRNVYNQHVEPIFTGSSGLGYMCANDAIYKRTIQSRIDKVVVTYDPTDAVRDSIGNSYSAFYRVELVADRRELRVTINLSAAQSGTNLSSLSEKLDEVLDVRVEQKQRDVEKEVDEMRSQLASAFGTSVSLTVDWRSFTEHAAFLAKSLDDRGRVVTQISQLVGAIAMYSESLTRTAINEPTAKTILAREIKSVVLAIDPTDAVKDTTIESEYTQHYRVIHTGAPSYELRVTCNLNGVEKSLHSFYDKVDSLFDLSVAKAQREGQAELEKYAAKLRDKGIATDGIKIDYARFVPAREFVAKSASEKGQFVRQLINRVAAVVEESEGLLRLCDTNATAMEWARAHVKSIVLAYDPTSSIADPAKDNHEYSAFYSVGLSDDGVLAITINLNASSSLNELQHKLVAQLYYADARKRRFPAAIARHRAAIEVAIGHSVELSFDWASLNSAAFLYWKTQAQVAETLQTEFEKPDGFLAKLAELVAQVCSTPMGKQALAAAVSRVTVTTVVGSRGTNLPSLTIVKEATSGLLEVVAPSQFQHRHEWDVDEWRESVEFQLGQTVPVAKHYALLAIQGIEKEISGALGKHVPVTIDWTHIEAPAFLKSQGPGVVTQRIRTLSQALAKSLLVRGLATVCAHPVGKSTVNDTIARVVISLDPTADYSATVYGKFPSLLTIGGADKTLLLRTNAEGDASKERFKERIEFALDLVVRIAESNAQAKHDAAQASVSAAVGRPARIHSDLSFTSEQAFRVLPPAQQADIVTALCAQLPELALASADGLLGVVAHQVGKTAAAAAIDVVHLTADPNNKQPPSRGALTLDRSCKTLRLTLNMADVLASLTWQDWKPRMADVLGVLLDVAKIEAAAALALTATKLAAALGKPTPVELDWAAFVGSREWTDLPAGVKLGCSADVAGALASKALLGYEGLAGLAEFDDVKATVNQHVKSVRFVIDPRAAQTTAVAANGVLTLALPLAKLTSSVGGDFGLPSVRFLVEDALGLKPAIQAAVVRETDAALAGTEAGLSRALGKPIKLRLDWDALFASALYKSTQDYVRFVRQRVAPLAATAFEGKGDGLAAMWAANGAARTAMQQRFNELKLCVDTTNQCRPPQHRFIPQYYKVAAEGASTLAVHMQIDELGGRGCGAVIEWVLTPDVAAAKEKAEITRIANARREDELARRERAVRDASEDNERAQKQYQKDLSKYERDMKTYEKEVKEKHHHCKGTGWLACGGSYHQKNSTFKSCQYCNGKGGHKCGLCKGTGLKYPGLKPPAMPKPPKMKTIPTFPPISSIDFTHNIA